MTKDPQPLPLAPTDPNFRIWNGTRLGMVIKADPPCLKGIGTDYKVLVSHHQGAALIRWPLRDEVRFFPFTLAEFVAPQPWSYPIMDDEFMDFEDFVLLDEVHDTHVGYHCSGLHWLVWYTAAKENWERFGGNPPPVGTKVQMLRSGFGGGAGVVRVIEEHVTGEDNVYQHLVLSDPADTGPHPGHYCSDLKLWFRDFRVLSLPPA